MKAKEAIRLARAYVDATGSDRDIAWRALRAAVAGPQCRENGWVKYVVNGSGVKERGIGDVGWAIVEAASEITGHDYIDELPVRVTWWGAWPRTQQSINAEDTTVRVIEAAIAAACAW